MLGTFASFDKAHLPCLLGEHAHMAKKTALEVLAENLEALRVRDGRPLSQAAIAKRSDVDQKTISRILNKTNQPSVDVLDGLGKAFGCEPWQLLVPALDVGRIAKLGRISPLGLEVAELFDALPARRRRLLYAHIQDMHNPDATDADGTEPTETPKQPAV